MARTGRRRTDLLPAEVLDRFKYEIANELGLTQEVQSRGWAEMKTRDVGKIGGHIGGNMVRVMIRYAEEALGRGERLG
ncbi:MAG: alpha/beta-type small acid-soluble spore protein [Bacillota bacterium]